MKKILLLFVAMLSSIGAWANDEFITDVMVIGGTQSEIDIMKPFYEAAGWTIIDQDLNAGCGSGSDYIYLLFKTASDSITSPDFITEFLLLKTGADAPDSVVNTSNNRTYYLVGYDGGSNFRETKGDLNSNAHGDYIHLYYSKYTDTYGIDYRVIKSIYFDNVSNGAVTSGAGLPACDLNDGAGGDYIYMHLEKSQGWLVTYNYTGTECYINDFEGPKGMIPSITVPDAINSAQIIDISNDTFKGFTNLESLFFYQGSKISQMPSVKGCSKLEHINVTAHQDITYNSTPSLMTSIPANAFAGTAIEQIYFQSVTNVGADVFSGCKNLWSVTFNVAPVLIEYDAFSNIKSYCSVSYPGSIEDWNPMMYMYSPMLVVNGKSDNNTWSCGWCGAANDSILNHLYWTFVNNHLKINCATDIWDTHPSVQLITTDNWNKVKVKLLTIEHVDTIAESQFWGYDYLKVVDVKSGVRIIGRYAFSSCSLLETVYLPSSVTKIWDYAFNNCGSLHNLYFDGTETQWNNMTRLDNWNKNVANDFKAHWHCMVTFNANGHGTAPDPVSILWSNEDKLDEPTAPTANGYEFTGWYTDAGCTTPWNFNDVIPGDMTLYAGWRELKPGDANGDGTVDVNDVTTTINYILGKNPSPFSYDNANVNGDDTVNVMDVTLIINLILGIG